MAVDLGDVAPQPPRGHARVQLRLHDDAAVDDVQASGEPQQSGHLGLAAARPGDRQPAELVLHCCRHRHGAAPPPTIVEYAAASSSGSCRGDPSAMPTSASTRCPPADFTTSSNAAGSGTVTGSASTTSNFIPGACARSTSTWASGVNPL